jgi:hypothetical protein
MAADDWTPVDEKEAAGGGWLDTANDFGRAVSNAATFGMANRLKGYISGTGTDEQARLSEEARQRSPYASIAGDVYGSFAIPSLGAGGLAARMGGGALARGGAYGATGAVTGAAQGAGNTYTGNPTDYLANAGIGAAIGAPLGAVGGAAFGRGPAVTRAETPTQAELWAAKNTGYGALGRSGARYEQSALRDVANEAEQRLLADRFHWRDSPGTWRGIEEARGGGAPGQLNTGLGAPVDPGNIDFIVKGLNKIPKTEATLTDRESARILKRTLNDFIENPPPGAVLPGTEQAASQASTLARNASGDYGAYKRVQAVDELINNAQNTAGATHSGLNLQNELRKGVRTFIKEKGGESVASKAGFIPAETEAMTLFSRGTLPTNALRYTSAALGGGGGIGAPIAAAAYGTGGGVAGQYFKDDPATAGAVGLMAPVLGTGLRMLGNRRANNEIAAMRDMIARRSPLYDYRTSMSGMQPGAGSPQTAKALRDTLALALLKQQTRPEQKYESW